MRISSAICFLLLGTLSVAAQTACIEGRVLDNNGSPIPDIQLIGVGTRWSAFTTGTDSEGRFRIANLSAGDYGIATGEEFRIDFNKIRFSKVKAIQNVPHVTVTAIEGGLLLRYFAPAAAGTHSFAGQGCADYSGREHCQSHLPL